MKLKCFIVLAFVLIAGLIAGFFIGFGITNQELDVDWEIINNILIAIIGAVIPSIVALFIFLKWKDQKGGEVIANEAKQSIKDLLEIIKTVHIMANKTSASDDFKVFNNLYESFVRSSLYINDCVEIKGLKDGMDQFFDSCLGLMRLKPELQLKLDNGEFKKNADLIGNNGIKLVNTLIPYSTYQKKFVFKHKK